MHQPLWSTFTYDLVHLHREPSALQNLKLNPQEGKAYDGLSRKCHQQTRFVVQEALFNGIVLLNIDQCKNLFQKNNFRLHSESALILGK